MWPLLAIAQFTSMKAKVTYVCGEGYLMASDEGRHYLAKVIKVGPGGYGLGERS